MNQSSSGSGLFTWRTYSAFAVAGLCALAMGCASKTKSVDAADSDNEGGGASLTSDSSAASLDRQRRELRANPSRSQVNRANAAAALKKLTQARRAGQDEAVRAAASEVLLADPSELSAQNALALSYLRQGHPGMAKTILQRALASNEKSAPLHNNLGIIALQEGDLQVAIQFFKEALSLDGRLNSASANLGSIYARFGDCERALPLLERAYGSLPADLSLANNFALCLSVRGSRSRAAEIFGKILASDPRHPPALYNYAIMLIEYENKMSEGASILGRLKFVGVTPEMADVVAQLERKLAASNKSGN